MYFEEEVKDQGGKETMDVEFGRSSFYKVDSIYLKVNGKGVIMDRTTEKRFVESMIRLGEYHGLVE